MQAWGGVGTHQVLEKACKCLRTEAEPCKMYAAACLWGLQVCVRAYVGLYARSTCLLASKNHTSHGRLGFSL